MSKKLLLSAATLLASAVVFGQVNKNVVPIALKASKVKIQKEMDPIGPISTFAPKPPTGQASPSSVGITQIGSSTNIYTALVTDQSCLSADQGTGLISFTYRQNAAIAGSAGSGSIQISSSSDLGVTWDSIVPLEQVGNYRHRYPSGVIFNPSGNTNPANAFNIFAGPVTDGGAWWTTFFGSCNADGNNASTQYLYEDSAGTINNFICRQFLQACDNGDVHILSTDVDANEEFYDNIVLNNATLNTGTSSLGPISQNQFWVDSAGFSGASMAWSQDGQTGFVVIFTADSSSTSTYPWTRPYVYKTTDAGATWNLDEEVAWDQIPALINSIPSTTDDSTKVLPFILTNSDFDMTVDANNHLHMFMPLTGHFYSNPDSSSYYFGLYNSTGTYTGTHAVYDIFQTDNGWDALFIDSLYTQFADSANSPISDSPPVTYGHRVQASRSADGTKVFCVWEDSPSDFGFQYLQAPDVKAWGMDVNSGNHSEPTNFTTGTQADGTAFFHFASNITLKNNDTYTIPVTISFNSSNLATDPYNHFYLSGIEFYESDFVGIDEKAAGSFEFTIFPNPAGSQESIAVSAIDLKQGAKVELSTLYGQKLSESVMSISGQQASAQINVLGLSKGIYLISVLNGNSKSVKKLILN